MLAIRSFQLVQALSKLEAVFSDVLLADKHSLYLSAALMQDLDDQFMHHDFTIQSFQQGLKVDAVCRASSKKLAVLCKFVSMELQALKSDTSHGAIAYDGDACAVGQGNVICFCKKIVYHRLLYG